MKLPKQFGRGGMPNVGELSQALERAKNMEDELADLRVQVEREYIKAEFDGNGLPLTITIDPELVDPEDVATLEDMVVAVVRDGYEKAKELRDARMKEIMPDIPNIPGFGL